MASEFFSLVFCIIIVFENNESHYKKKREGKKRYMMYVCEFRSLWEINFLPKVIRMLILLMAKAEVQFLFALLTSGAIYSGVVIDLS